MSKNLVYISIFCDINYLEFFKLFILSIKLFSKTDTFNLLILTTPDFQTPILSITDRLDIPVKFKYLECTTPEQASSARLRIFEYEEIDNYEKLLYLDIDILIQQDITTLFNFDMKDKLYALREGYTIRSSAHGGWFFDFTKISQSIFGFNAGVLLFQNTQSMKILFKDTLLHMKTIKEKNGPMPQCWEQPFINYHTIKNNLHNTDFLVDYVNLTYFITSKPISPTENKKIIFNHFYYKDKIIYMKLHMTHLLTYFINTHTSYDKNINDIINKHYSYLSIQSSDTVIETEQRLTNKNLVYISIFCDKNYIEFFELFILSMKLFSKTNTFDLLILTTPDFQTPILSITDRLDIPVKFKYLECTTPEQASSARLRIFEYEEIDNYNKLLYLDTDILIQQDLTRFFTYNIEDKLYAAADGCSIWHQTHGSWFFDFEKIDKSTPGFNAGVLLFQNTQTMKTLFSNILSHMVDVRTKMGRMPPAWEQPFINYNAIHSNIHSFNYMNDSVCLTMYPDDSKATYMPRTPASPSTNTQIIVHHFLNSFKLHFMKIHINHLLQCCVDMSVAQTPSIDNIMYKQYTWEKTGRIIFHKDNVIITTWGRGTYILFNNYVVKATWNNYNHILIFNSTYEKYTSIHYNSIKIQNGVIDRSLKDTIPKEVSMGTRNLVYFCAFHNKGYLDLLRILLSGVKLFSTIDNIDFLVLTDEEFLPTVSDISVSLDIPIKTQIFNFKTQHEAGCARLFIFNYKDIDNYNKILYLDTDISVQNDISQVFNVPIEDNVYAVQEYDINGEGHGAWFFDFKTMSPSTPAINSGILLFQNTQKIRKIFFNINKHIANLKVTGSLLPNCMDQSFIVYHLFTNKAVDNQLMKKYAYLSEHNPPPFPSAPTDLTFVHFVWPIGNTYHKMMRMIEHSKNTFNKYTTLKYNLEPYLLKDILNKQYKWGTGIGTIQFTYENVLVTSWGLGVYKQLDKHTVEVSWRGRDYILKMNTSFTLFNGWDKQSLNITRGVLVEG